MCKWKDTDSHICTLMQKDLFHTADIAIPKYSVRLYQKIHLVTFSEQLKYFPKKTILVSIFTV